MIDTLLEKDLLPDALLRAGIRRLLARRLRAEAAVYDRAAYLADLKTRPIAEDTQAANTQHYEVPADFFRLCLGRRLKYSCGLYPTGAETLDDAEERMLDLYVERARLADGQDVLELGCGWGSLTLWMAERYPASRITAVSNSASQREFIMARARERGLGNVEVLTADANHFDTAKRFDRVVSVEMFEHMRNYAVLMERIAGWLRDEGRLFVHIFCHRELMYPFTTEGADDWMGRYFFTGGLMPAEHTLLYFQQHLRLQQQWRVAGTHYERTANAWLACMDERREAVMAALAGAYGDADAQRWFQRWRMFFMACAELFGYRGGTEWFVAHYRFAR